MEQNEVTTAPSQIASDIEAVIKGAQALNRLLTIVRGVVPSIDALKKPIAIVRGIFAARKGGKS